MPFLAGMVVDSKARSTKTRIETLATGDCWGINQQDSKARSTKTRIETWPHLLQLVQSVAIQKQDPLKQGLKLIPSFVGNKERKIQKQDPLKQGLKQGKFSYIWVAEPHIQKQDPLKQGLKQSASTKAPSTVKDSKARSTKTRIETALRLSLNALSSSFKSKIH